MASKGARTLGWAPLHSAKGVSALFYRVSALRASRKFSFGPILRLEITPVSEGYRVSGTLGTPCALSGVHLARHLGVGPDQAYVRAALVQLL